MPPKASKKAPVLKNVSTARTKLLLNQPFFATLLLTMPVEYRDDLWLMATDGKRLSVNPTNCEALPVPQIQTVLCHEVMHVAFQHVPTMLRLKLDQNLWNMATDYAINLVLVESGMTPIDGWLYDTQYKGLTALQIYDRLLQNPPPPQGGGSGKGESGSDASEGSGSGRGDQSQRNTGPGGSGWDLEIPEHAGDPAEMAKDAREVAQRVAQAANMARMAGKMPAGLDRLITAMLEPVVPWQTVLQDYMTRVSKDDETWRRRNRRFTHTYLPSRHSDRMGEVVFIGDTSGSIQNAELSRMATEVTAIAEQLRPELIRLLWADTEVAGEQLFECGEAIECKPQGGGGTDMRVPLAYAEEHDPQVVVLATDGYTPWPDVAPPYPLIVLCTTSVECPEYAQVIRV